MKFYILLFLLVFSINSCSQLAKEEKRPKYIGIEEELKPYIDDFMSLSAEKHLSFSKNITAGITKIKRGRVVGTCYSGDGYRELEIDKEYWTQADDIQRRVLIAHELIHCLCNRGHTYSGGKEYDTIIYRDFTDFLGATGIRMDSDGYFPDKCPISLMNPVLPAYGCIVKYYYEQYINEMFEGCKPWQK